MAAAPPTTTLTAGIRQPHPLKGVVNGNDDPTRCAACSVVMQDVGKVSVSHCCGRGVCDSCVDVERELKHCPQCNSPFRLTPKEIIACLKKQSKKGHPWAQARLGSLYCVGDEIRQSLSEALHWNREAAKRGHPTAIEFLGSCFLYGTGACPVDLQLAQEYFEFGLMACSTSFALCYEACQEGLVEIAKCHLETKSFEKARTILLPLAEEGMSNAQKALGDAIVYDYEGRSPCEQQHCYSWGLLWYSSAAFAAEGDNAAFGNAEHSATICCDALQKYAQAKFWGRIVKKTLRHPEMSDKVRATRVITLVNVQRELRALRETCGGCGAEFEGKERKFCRACRAYCYCSRECQKMHWNRKEGGHREDCKDASELKQKMKEKKKAEAIKASESK